MRKIRIREVTLQKMKPSNLRRLHAISIINRRQSMAIKITANRGLRKGAFERHYVKTILKYKDVPLAMQNDLYEIGAAQAEGFQN